MRVKLRCLGLGDLAVAWVTLLFVVSTVRCVSAATSIGRIGLESLALGRALKMRSRHLRLHPDPRPRRRTVSSRTGGSLSSGHEAASGSVNENGVPSIHMRCRITASLRAMATSARLRPFERARRAPHAFSDDHLAERVRMMLAAA